MKEVSDATMSSRLSDPKSKADADAEVRVQIGEERVTVGKVEVERISARIALRTHLDEIPVSQTLRTERVEIDRVAVDRIVAETPVTRVEDGVTIIPVVEEVLVRQFRIVEEIRVTRHADTADHPASMVLRRQEAVIEEMSNDAPPGGADAASGPV